jgi:ssDNA-binding replication factor A large subunit
LSCLVFTAMIFAGVLSSCSKNGEDIAAPSITFIQPVENDTVQLKNGYMTIEVLAQDRVNVSDMEMKVKDNSGKVLYSYDKDDISNQSYTCHEVFYPKGIAGITQMKLSVIFSNEYENWTSKSITFYVRP